jgi:predicted RNA polymerase sigma factor
MSGSMLLKGVTRDTTGPEIPMRVLGNREVPGKMTLQIGVEGQANVHIQGRLARDAPWLDIGTPYQASTLLHLDPVPFLRAVSAGMGANSNVSVWVVWGW